MGLFVSVSKNAGVKLKSAQGKGKQMSSERDFSVSAKCWRYRVILISLLNFLFNIFPRRLYCSFEMRLRIYYKANAGHSTAKFENVVLKM